MKTSRQSTSAHTLNADKRLSKWQRIAWMAHNLRNNALPNAGVDKRIIERGFRTPPDVLDALWHEVASDASPSRRLCDFFWLRLPWDKMLATLEQARVLEVGCGSGVYGRLIERQAGERFEYYRGVDIDPHPAWPSFANDARFSFVHGRAAQGMEYFEDANIILTQSALEHFEEDLLFFEQLAQHVNAARHPIVQFHLVPSAACLLTYPWHGVREYTPRTLSRITRLFDDNTRIYLYRLGGRRSNKLHRAFITWPRYLQRVDLRDTQTDRYEAALRQSLEADDGADESAAAFYALALVTGFADDPFSDWQ